MSIEVSIIVALLAAMVTAVGWFITHRNNRLLTLRKDRLDLINEQLSQLYGPLYVSCEAGRSAYQTLLKKLGRTKDIFDEDRTPSESEIREWFHWMKYVISPINERREKLILENCHLIREDRVPACILEFQSHVACYRAILAKWEAGDFSEQYAIIDYPQALDSYVSESFAALKKEQGELIGLLQYREDKA